MRTKFLLIGLFGFLPGILYNQSERAKVTIRYEESADHHLFDVTDNGMGIEKQFHEQIFKMFTTLQDRSFHRSTGLGLNVVQKLLHKAGGTIKVLRSTPGEGSTFRIELPILELRGSKFFGS